MATTKIAEISDRAACPAWCPFKSHPDVVALGTKDSGGVGFEDSGGELELYDINVASSEQSPKLLASLKTTTRFSSITWTTYTGNNEFSLGLLLGGMTDGVIYIWDAFKLVNDSTNPDAALLGSVTMPGAGPITAMATSPLDTHKLCAGAANGKVAIVDLTNPRNPQTSEPEPDFTPGAGITAVSWNTQVAHIVATATGDGLAMIWDLKANKKWCEIRAEQAGQGVADLHWNPAQGLHLLTASADDRNPVLRLWDLGASTSMPLATLTGHSAGIFKTSWCPHDPSLLLSCGKDHYTLLWDLYTLKPIAQLPEDTTGLLAANSTSSCTDPNTLFANSSLQEQKHLRYDVLWSPLKRGVALTCSLDRKVQIHSVQTLVAMSGRPPAWMRPTSCVATGFGGALVYCTSRPADPDTNFNRVVTIRTIPEQPDLVQTVVQTETERAISSDLEFCRARSNGAPWGFLRVIFETNARQELLGHLQFSAQEIANQASQYSQDLANGVSHLSVSDDELNGKSTQMSRQAQDMVKKALLVGNFEAAVECCFSCGNFADALLLASCGGAELWSKTQERYFAQESPKRPFLSIASAIIRNQLDEIVAESDIEQWQETLAILATYGQSEEFPRLCIALGDRLQASGNEESAASCYMCALHLEGAAQYWKKQLEASQSDDGSLDLDALHDFVVKVSVLRNATGPTTPLPPDIAALFNQYAKALADQGLYMTAAKYSQNDPTDLSSQILRDRLYRSRASQRCYAAMGVAPEFPYTMVTVEKSRGQTLASAVRQQEAQQLQQQQQAASHASYDQQQQQSGYAATTSAPAAAQQEQPSSADQLPSGWIALQDPASGQTYYANQTTGETTWDRPQPAAVVPTPAPSQPVATNGTSAASTRKAALVSRYGDGFVTSASHPELANQYGNRGTSNPYKGAARPGTAAAVVGSSTTSKTPVSGSLNFDKVELTADHTQIKDVLLGVVEALKSTSLNPVENRQVTEAEKGIAILVKKLAIGALGEDTTAKVYSLVGAIGNQDMHTASAIQTDLANHDWRDHKDWLKGLKLLIQLGSKKL